MTIVFHKPVGPVGEVVSLMVYHRDYRPPHTVERFLPDGGIDLVIDLSDQPKYVYDNDSLRAVQTCRRSWLSGMRTAPISISVGSGCGMLVISLVPAHSSRVVHHPMHLFCDRVVDAEDVLGTSFTALRNRLMGAKDEREIFRRSEEWLSRRITMGRLVPDGVTQSTALLADQPTLHRIDWFARNANVSGKHLSRLYRDYVGVSPKRYQQIQRFQSVVIAAEQAAAINWTAIAHDCGFYDQSHLITEFRRFSGFAPSEYVQRRGDIRNWVPIAEG